MAVFFFFGGGGWGAFGAPLFFFIWQGPWAPFYEILEATSKQNSGLKHKKITTFEKCKNFTSLLRRKNICYN